MITALGRVAYGLENLPGIIIREASNEDLQRSFEHELRLLVEWIRTFEVPQSWLQECVSCNRLHPHVGPLWRDFCTRIAAELGVEPSYGRPIAELASETRTALAPKNCATGEHRSLVLCRALWVAGCVDLDVGEFRSQGHVSPVGLKQGSAVRFVCLSLHKMTLERHHAARPTNCRDQHRAQAPRL